MTQRTIEPYRDETLPERFLRWIETIRQRFKTIPNFTEFTGSPEGVIFGQKADSYYDLTNDIQYVKTTATGNTGWIQCWPGLSSGAGFQGLGSWNYRTQTTAFPTSGRMQFDNATIGSATEMYINEVNAGGFDVTVFLAMIESGDLMYVQVQNDATKFAIVEVGTPVLNADVWTFPILNISGQGGSISQNTSVSIVVAGGGGGGGGGGSATPLVIIGDIVMATPPVSAAYTALLRYMDLDQTDEVGRIGYTASGNMEIVNDVVSGLIRMYTVTGVTATENLRLRTGSTVTDYRKGPYAEVGAFRCSTTRTQSFSEEDPPFRVVSGVFGATGEFDPSVVIWGNGQIQAYTGGIAAGDINLNPQGGDVHMFGADSVTLGHGGITKAATMNTGFTVRNTSNTSPNTGTVGADAQCMLTTRGGSPIAFMGIRASDDVAYLGHDIHGQSWVIEAQNSGGSDREIAYFNPDTGCMFNEPGIEAVMARTALTAAGGFEVFNTVTGAGFERVLTTSDSPSISPINTQNGDYTLVLADAGKTIHKASGGAGETLTIPANGAVAYPIGTWLAFDNGGGGDVTIAITTDTMTGTDGLTGSRTLGDNQRALAQKLTATTWRYSASDL